MFLFLIVFTHQAHPLQFPKAFDMLSSLCISTFTTSFCCNLDLSTNQLTKTQISHCGAVAQWDVVVRRPRSCGLTLTSLWAFGFFSAFFFSSMGMTPTHSVETIRFLSFPVKSREISSPTPANWFSSAPSVVEANITPATSTLRSLNIQTNQGAMMDEYWSKLTNSVTHWVDTVNELSHCHVSPG